MKSSAGHHLGVWPSAAFSDAIELTPQLGVKRNLSTSITNQQLVNERPLLLNDVDRLSFAANQDEYPAISMMGGAGAKRQRLA